MPIRKTCKPAGVVPPSAALRFRGNGGRFTAGNQAAIKERARKLKAERRARKSKPEGHRFVPGDDRQTGGVALSLKTFVLVPLP